MSEFERAKNLIRAYVNRESERLRGIPQSAEEKELNDYLKDPKPALPKPAEVSSKKEVSELASVEPEVQARMILGIGEDVSFVQMRKKYRDLSKRLTAVAEGADTESAEKAKGILKRVDWAYKVLESKADITERRFGTLEFE
jgi:hypothetical protein